MSMDLILPNLPNNLIKKKEEEEIRVRSRSENLIVVQIIVSDPKLNWQSGSDLSLTKSKLKYLSVAYVKKQNDNNQQHKITCVI